MSVSLSVHHSPTTTCLFVCPFTLKASIASVYIPILFMIISNSLPWCKKSKSMIKLKWDNMKMTKQLEKPKVWMSVCLSVHFCLTIVCLFVCPFTMYDITICLFVCPLHTFGALINVLWKMKKLKNRFTDSGLQILLPWYPTESLESKN